MLYEEQILIQLEEKGFQRDKVVRYLDANKHNHETTCYYLILKKLERQGKIDKRKYFSGQNFLGNTLVADNTAQTSAEEDAKQKKDLNISKDTSMDTSQLVMEKQYLTED